MRGNILRLFIFLFVLFAFAAKGQIIDDSTKLVYGPTSTRYITVEDLKHNDTLFHTMDTTLTGIESFQVKKKQKEYHYDLGNNGTAIIPIYFQLPESIGRRTGFHVYDPYVKKVKDFRYYDTKSPYIELDIALGAMGRNYVDFSFSRNVNPQLNIGMDITRVASLKQLGGASLRERQVLGTSYDLYTYYHTKKRNYHVMFHMYRFEHSANETGGVPSDIEDDREFFQYQNSLIELTRAFSEDKRERFFLYQQFRLTEYLELFSSTKYNNVRNRYIDGRPDQTYYEQILIRSDSTNDASQLKEWDNKLGIKGRVVDRLYYSAYLRRRDLGFTYRFLDPIGEEAENYIGGDLKLWITPNNRVGGRTEVMDEGQFFLEGYFENKFLNARYLTTRYLPAMMTERYFGNHYDWANNFESILVNTIKGSANYDFKFVRLEPEIELTAVKNHTYFGRDKLPAQFDGTVLVNKYSLKADFRLGNFRLDNHLLLNKIAGENRDIMRMPDWNWFGRWYYDNRVLGDQMEFQVGLNLRWQSSYFGRAYDPITQQMYLQDALEVESYFTSDLFFIMKSFDLTLFVNVNYLNQVRDKGYWEVPYYPGMRRVVDLGVRWMFFE